MIVHKWKICHIVDFAGPVHLEVKMKERGNRVKCLDLTRKLTKSTEHKTNGDTYCYGCVLYCKQSFDLMIGGTCGVMVIVVRNGHGNTSSKPGRDWLHFT